MRRFCMFLSRHDEVTLEAEESTDHNILADIAYADNFADDARISGTEPYACERSRQPTKGIDRCTP